jgi:hypothetical protein
MLEGNHSGAYEMLPKELFAEGFPLSAAVTGLEHDMSIGWRVTHMLVGIEALTSVSLHVQMTPISLNRVRQFLDR